MITYIKRLVRTILLGSVVLMTLFQPWHGQAQGNAAITLSANFGFDGFCKDGQWLPIRVEVENTGADLDVTVKAAYKNGNDGETSTSVALALPAGARKEFFLYIYLQGFVRGFNVSVLDGKQVLEKVNLTANCMPPENLIFGVISDNPAAFDALGDIKPLIGVTRVAHIQVADLPERAQAWSALSGLVISNVDTATFSPAQKLALEAWVASGGTLLVTGGARWQGTVAGLNEMLPIIVNRTQSVFDLSALQTYTGSQSPLEAGTVLSVGAMREDAQVLVEQGGVPLLINKPFGFGSVYFLAADPSVQPLSSWQGLTGLYDQLFASRPPKPRWFSNTAWYSYSANQALGAIPQLGLPSVFYIICLLGLYVLIIGPLNFLILRRTKRRELAWVTIPVLVIVFSCLSYGTGFAYRGTTPILNRLVVAQAWDGVDQANVRALVGVYSPVRARYDLEALSNFLPAPYNGQNGDAQAGNNWMLGQDGQTTILPDVRVEIAGMKAVALEGTLPALPISHDLVLQVGRLNPVLTGTITNNSEYILRDAYLVTPQEWQSLGDFGSGRTEDLVIPLTVDTSGNAPPFLDPFSNTIYGSPYGQTDVDEARKTAFFQTVMAYDYQRVDSNWGVYLIGWVDAPILPVGLRDQRTDTVDTMLYVQSLTPTIKLDTGALKIPVTLMTWEANNVLASPYYTSNIPVGGYELRFKPAFPLTFSEVESLTLTLFTSALPGELTVYAWDFAKSAWVSVSTDSTSTVIRNPERYVSASGEVRLKVTTTRSDWTEVRSAFVTLVVKP